MKTVAPTGRPVLDLALTLLLRSTGEVQIGWDPDHAVLIQPPAPVSAAALATLLNRLDGSLTVAELAPVATSVGLEAAALEGLLDELAGAGLLRWVRPHGTAGTSAVHVHGRGPLSDAIAEALAMSGTILTRSVDARSRRCDWPAAPAVVVLADELVTDPCLSAELVGFRVAHLQVRVRDGIGVVGPMVLPGRTSCLRCADLHRAEQDSEWPTLAAQLLGQVGHGSAATIRATAGIALGQVEHLLRGPGAGLPPPRTLNATIEVDSRRAELRRRLWAPHPRCGCGAHR